MWCEGLSLSDWKTKYRNNKDYHYLHGNCDDWVINHCKDGDTLMVISGEDEKQTYLYLVHCFIMRNGKYMDVRGETNKIEDILEDFEELKKIEYKIYSYHTIKEFNEKIFELLNP